jgi:hypothetical protein
MTIEQQRAAALNLCSNLNITVLQYGNAWWLMAESINQVIGEIAGLSESDLVRMQRPAFSRT